MGILKKVVLPAAISATLGLAAAQAQELITNGSFENPSATFANNGQGYMTLASGSTTIPGWTVTNDSLAWVINGIPFGIATPFGSFFLDLTGTHDNSSFAGMSQTIPTSPGQTYRVSVSLGADQDVQAYSGQKSVSVIAGGSNATFVFDPTGSGNQWGTFTFDFVATSSATGITIAGTGTGVGLQYLGFDNVSVVPVPPTLTIAPASPGQVTISWFPATAGYVLQESLSLALSSWTNSPSGATKPITVSAASGTKFYRLFHP